VIAYTVGAAVLQMPSPQSTPEALTHPRASASSTAHSSSSREAPVRAARALRVATPPVFSARVTSSGSI